MSDNTEAYSRTLRTLKDNPVLERLRETFLDSVSKEDLKKLVDHLSSVGEDDTLGNLPAEKTPSSSSRVADGSHSSSRSSLVRTESRDPSIRAQSPRSNNQSRCRQPSPKVVLPFPRPIRTRQVTRRTPEFPMPVSRALLFKDVTLISDDSESESEEVDKEVDDGDLSMDELLGDTPKPVSKGAVTPKEQLQDIEWVFWICPKNRGGYWKPFSEFPQRVRALFESKFNADYLTKPRHVENYARMLRNQSNYLDRNRCVGNLTYNNQNTLNKWTKTNNDKEKTCNTCFNCHRFCARVVKTGTGIQLGFYPLPYSARLGSIWTDVQYWARNK